ncbi:MAG: NAD(P)/FAD-dependent oxidoreductase [Patescibacteria group bacterium]
MDSAFDVIVIGSGAAGLSAALGTAQQGASVALVERSTYLGGECPNSACVPTQTLLRAAKTYHLLQHADQLGLPMPTDKAQYRQIKSFKDAIVAQTGGRHLTAARLKEQGVELIRGEAHFADLHTLVVDNKRHTGRQFVIATGSRPCPPARIGLEHVPYLTHREAIELTTLPSSLIILGGGPIGVEFAVLFAIFGVDVTLAEYGKRILPNEDAELSEFIAKELTGFGITVLTDYCAEQVTSHGQSGITMSGRCRGQRRVINSEQLLVACGSTPNVEALGIDRLGVVLTDDGIQTDDYLRTTVPHIWAVGDVTRHPHYTHTAHYEGSLVAHNLTQQTKRALDLRVVPRALATFTDIASVGKTEEELTKQQRPYIVGRADVALLGRSLIDQTSAGFIKLLVDPDTGHVLGASIAAPQSHELIHEIAVAMKAQLHIDVLATLLHAYPTYAEGIAVAASDAGNQLPPR